MRRSYILSAASAIALTAGWASSASAFDKVVWDWYLNADTDIKVDVDVDIAVDPSGATIVEVDQDFKGDLTAVATVTGVVNNPPAGEWVKIGWNWHFVTEGLDGAADLPAIENLAAAIANATSIESEVSVQADIDQEAGEWYDFTTLSAVATVAGVLNATVENTAQAVGNSASITLDPAAVNGGISGEVNSGPSYPCYIGCGSGGGLNGVDTNAFLMANIEQDAYLNATAIATVAGVAINGYDDLGLGDSYLGRPIVDNTAIAVGNVANITLVTGSLDD